MKIALVKQQTGYFSPIDRVQYAQKLFGICSQTGADIVVGPELSLANRENLISPCDFDRFSKDLGSQLGHSKLVIPGTGFVYDSSSKELANKAPIIYEGRVFYVTKKSSHDEEDAAKSLGATYLRGKVGCSVFDYMDHKVAVEICRDHGLGRLKNEGVRDANLHFILSCNGAGIIPEKIVIEERGIVALVDGHRNVISAYEKTNDQLKELKGRESKEYFLVEI